MHVETHTNIGWKYLSLPFLDTMLSDHWAVSTTVNPGHVAVLLRLLPLSHIRRDRTHFYLSVIGTSSPWKTCLPGDGGDHNDPESVHEDESNEDSDEDDEDNDEITGPREMT